MLTENARIHGKHKYLRLPELCDFQNFNNPYILQVPSYVMYPTRPDVTFASNLHPGRW